MADPILRDVTEADIPAIAGIYAHHVLTGLASFEETAPDAAEMAARFAALKARSMPYICVAAGDRVLGYAYAGPYRPRIAYRHTVEDSIYLAPGQEGRGLGRLLLAELIGRCTGMGLRQMVAVIGDSGNAGSIGLHRALGFREIGTLRSVGFKFGRWVDSVFMQRALGEGDTTLP
ncbi:MAG: N-acetyltransferase family protein [Reyranellaceae bacterium]